MKELVDKTLLPYLGSHDSLYRIEPVVFTEGPSYLTRGIMIHNGLDLDLTILTDRGMDIPFLRYKGKNIGFPSKNRVKSPFLFQENEARGFLQQFFVGFLTTVGIVHGGPGKDEYGLHGVANQLMAEKVSYRLTKIDNEVVIEVKGSVREAAVFGPNMVLNRRLLIYTESNKLVIHDQVVNEGFVSSPVKMLYHINFGYPMLSEDARVETTAQQIDPRDEEAKKGLAEYNLVRKPRNDFVEQCFFHKDFINSLATVSLINEQLDFQVDISFDQEIFPLLCQWNNFLSGDYAMGLEPSFPGIFNDGSEERFLQAGEKLDYQIEVIFKG